MGDPRRVRPDELEILVARELRKAGVALSRLALLPRRAATPMAAGEYSVEFGAVIGDDDARQDALIECRNQIAPIGMTAVQSLDARRRARPVDDGPARLLDIPRVAPVVEAADVEPRLAIMFSMSGYERDAVREAQSLGIALLAIADGPAAFRRSQWAVGAQPPAWVPEYMAEVVDLDPAGAVRYQMLVSGTVKLFPQP
jgi:hypothetical protein